MVLHHVPHGARLVVVGAAAGHADQLGNGDLHLLDVVRVPERLEERVGEADRHQVLHRLLPEVVVDPVDLRLVEVLAQLGVQRPGRGEVVPERLLHDDPAVGRRDPGLGQPLGDRGEQRRRHRQVKGADVQRLLVEPLGERRPAALARGIDRHIVDAVQELLDQLGLQELWLDELQPASHGRSCGTRPCSSSSAPHRSPASRRASGGPPSAGTGSAGSCGARDRRSPRRSPGRTAAPG